MNYVSSESNIIKKETLIKCYGRRIVFYTYNCKLNLEQTT